MRSISTALTLTLLPAVAFAASASSRKASLHQAEAEQLVTEISRGGNANAAVSKIKRIGQEGFASHELASLIRKEPDLDRRRNMAQALAGLGHPEGEGALARALEDDDGPVRMYAAQGLGRMKSRGAAPKLAMALGDKTLGVRREAARALGAIADPKHGAVLAKATKAEEDPETRAAMLLALGQVGDKKQTAVLESFLGHNSESARFAAAAGLCVLGAPAGFKFAKARLESKDKYERMQGLMLFDGAKSKDVASVLEPLLKDPDRSLQATSARILYQGGDKSKLDWLVLASFQALGEDRLPYEKELETLRLTDDERRAILRKAGIK